LTSEVAVMNQRGIALAADSAVTLIEGGTVIVRNDQRKLYNLADGLPVGVMFFGIADIMGHPWEVLLDHFQKKAKPRPMPHVGDYAAKFTAMLDNLEEFFPRARQKDDYRRLLASVFRFILQFASFLRASNERQGVTDAQILRQAIDLVWHRYQFREDETPRGDLACFPPGFGAAVARDYAGVIDELIVYGFSNFNLDKQSEQRLRDIAVFCVVKDLFIEDVTGLVFAGYGSEDRYPAVVTYNVSAVVGGYVKRAAVDETAIDGDMHSAITLFADSEATYSFIRGIELDLEARIYGTAHAMCLNLVDHVVNSFGNADPAERESVRRQFQTQHVPQYIRRLYATISDYQQETYINPVLRALEIATKQDLAETAYGLVALNIFKKRIMAAQQTVGGAVDVAVISRDGGFQWSKRQGA